MRGKEIINMSEVFNNDFTSESNQQPSNSYPYSFEQPAAAQPQPSAPAPEQKKKGGKAGKIVALLLACALVGGGSGFGAAALMQKNAAAQPQSTTQASSDASVMLEAKRQAAALQVASVDTGKVLTPSEVYAQNVNSTVGITTSITTNYFGYQTTSAAAGSGFILTQDGYILTNYHVVEGSNSIKVTTYDGTSYDAQLIGYDESNDIAVLKIDATDLTPVVLGDSDTLNVGDTFPVIFEALIFTNSVECEPIFLVAMCVAAMIGAYTMAEIITKWDVNQIRIWLGCAMIGTAIIMACKNAGIGPFGSIGEGIGFTVGQWQFWVAVILNFFWGALMDVGFGLYAPCMATCLLLGCSGTTCFPVFMGSCALLMPANSIVFIKKSRYDVVATLGNMIGGCIGVFIAWKIITSLPMHILIYVVCVVLLWTSYSILSARAKDLKAKKA